jgi:hypothetical protein
MSLLLSLDHRIYAIDRSPALHPKLFCGYAKIESIEDIISDVGELRALALIFMLLPFLASMRN